MGQMKKKLSQRMSFPLLAVFLWLALLGSSAAALENCHTFAAPCENLQKQTARRVVDQVSQMVGLNVVNHSLRQPLVADLRKVTEVLERKNVSAALDLLASFTQRVNALCTVGWLSPEDATPLIKAASDFIAQLKTQTECAHERPVIESDRSSEVAGTYTLVEAAGQRLPAVVSENSPTGYKQEVTGGSVVLRPDEIFSWRTDYRETSGGRVWEHQSSGGGRYRLAGSTITFELDNHSGELKGTLRSGLLKMRADVELTYRKH